MYSNQQSYIAAVDAVSLAPLPWAKFSGTRFLITGATGLVGTFLVDVLMRRAELSGERIEVVAVGRNEAAAASRFRYANGADLFRFIAHDAAFPFDVFPDCDYIVHAAGNSHPRAFSTDPVGTMKANILGTLNLLEYARTHETRRLLYVSSGEVYGEGAGPDGFTEGSGGFIDSMLPRSCYPSGKRAAETLCVSYLAQYGTDSVVVRPSHIYGPTITASDSHAVAQFVNAAAERKDIVMKSAGTQVRSYCFVADCVQALLITLALGKAGEAYNIADRNSNVSIKELAATLAELAGTRLVMEVPDAVEKAGYTTVQSTLLDPSKLEALGWKPSTPLREGLALTVDVVADLLARKS